MTKPFLFRYEKYARYISPSSRHNCTVKPVIHAIGIGEISGCTFILLTTDKLRNTVWFLLVFIYLFAGVNTGFAVAIMLAVVMFTIEVATSYWSKQMYRKVIHDFHGVGLV